MPVRPGPTRASPGGLAGIACAALLALLAPHAASQTQGTAARDIFAAKCASCHADTRQGRIHLDNRRYWQAVARANTRDNLYALVIEGNGYKPPRAGHADLTDPDIRAVVDWMVDPAR